ncbi:hypothetical protein [Paraburkholderia oxyphila]|uniref:hypothetical protein n=1 Tax=Paraburkholderia oxyphila TaxID=614212 RepID=UPI0012EE674F|nr:hypothetical protein [Paraburkholderia oxyphila]
MDGIVRSQYRLPSDVDAWLAARAKMEERSKNTQLIVELRARRAEVEGRYLGAITQALWKWRNDSQAKTCANSSGRDQSLMIGAVLLSLSEGSANGPSRFV